MFKYITRYKYIKCYKYIWYIENTEGKQSPQLSVGAE